MGLVGGAIGLGIAAYNFEIAEDVHDAAEAGKGGSYQFAKELKMQKTIRSLILSLLLLSFITLFYSCYEMYMTDDSTPEPTLEPTQEPTPEPTLAAVPEINVKQGTTIITDETGTYDFGYVVADGDVGTEASAYVLFEIENLGDTDLTIASVTINLGDADDFDLKNSTISLLAPGSTTTFTIRFDPVTVGEKSATVTIANNDTDEGTFTFTITGITPGSQITETTGSVSFNMRLVPPGSYYVGPNPTPASNNVTLTRGYWMAETEVTYELWQNVYQWAIEHGYNFEHAGVMGIGDNTTNKHPVTEVSWRDCMVWCNALSEREELTPVYTYLGNVIKISEDGYATACDNAVFDYNANGYRLPTEVEWEIAARGASVGISEGTYETNYAGSNSIDNVAWYINNSDLETHRVGTKEYNELGIYDMSGNVREWCWDRYSANYPIAEINPTGASSGTERIMHGGDLKDMENVCNISYREYYVPDIIIKGCNFRLVKTK